MSLELSAKEKIFLLVAVRVSHFVLHFRYRTSIYWLFPAFSFKLDSLVTFVRE